MKIILSILIIVFSISIFSQPKPFDPAAYQNGQKNLSDREREHYNEYKKKYIKLGLETETKNGNLAMFSNYMLNLFYHYRIDIDKIEDYKKELDIDLKGISKGESSLNEGGHNLLFSHAIVIATVIGGGNTKLGLGPFRGEVLYSVDEVLKGEYYFEEFPKTIKCYYYNKIYQGDSLMYVYGEDSKLGDKCILFLNRRANSTTIENYEDYDKPTTYFNPFGYRIGTTSRLVNNFIEFAIDFAKKLESINIKESLHTARE